MQPPLQYETLSDPILVRRAKDGDPRAGYVLLDVTVLGIAVEFVRIEYDIEEAARAIIASELPDEFADFLRTGGQSSVQTKDA